MVTGACGIGERSGYSSVPPSPCGTFRTFISASHGVRASLLSGMPLAAESPQTPLTEQPDPVQALETAQLLEAVVPQGRPRSPARLLWHCFPWPSGPVEQLHQTASVLHPRGGGKFWALQAAVGACGFAIPHIYGGMAKSVVYDSCTGQISSRVI